MSPLLGHLVQSFFNDYLPVQKGLRLGSIRSYRDTVSLLLRFLAKHKHRPVAKLALEDLTLDSVLGFLAHLEQERRNSPRTRNQRRAALTTFFSYLAVRVPEMLAVCQQIASIPVKRTPLPDTHYLEREEMTALLRSMPRQGPFALAGSHRGCAGLGDRLQGAALVLGITLDGLDEVADEVVAPLELDVDLGPGLLHGVAQPDQTVVGAEEPQHQSHNDDAENDDEGHGHSLSMETRS